MRPGLFIWDKSKNDGLSEWVGEINGVQDTSFHYVTYIKNDPQNLNKHYLLDGNKVLIYENDEYWELPDSPYVGTQGDFEILPNGTFVFSNTNYITTVTSDGSKYVFETGVGGNIGAEIAYSPTDPNIVYSFANTHTQLRMFRSLNGGIDWEEIALPILESGQRHQSHDQTFEIYRYDQDRDLILWGTTSIYMAIIENNHLVQPDFKKLFAAHGDYHGSLVKDDRLYLYDDGGLFEVRISDLGEYFTTPNDYVHIVNKTKSLVNGLNTLQAMDISYQHGTNRLASGFWHNGGWLKDTTDSFERLIGGDGFQTAFHPSNKDIVYSSAQNINISRLNISIGEKSNISSNIDSGPFRSKIFTHKSYPDALFYFDSGIWYISDASSCIGFDCNPVKIDTPWYINEVRFDNTASNNFVYIFSPGYIEVINNLFEASSEIVFILYDEYENLDFVDIDIESTYDIDVIYCLVENFYDGYSLMEIKRQGDEVLVTEGKKNIFPEGVKPSRMIVTKPSLSENSNDQNFERNFVFATNIGVYTLNQNEDLAVPEVNFPGVEITEIEYDRVKGDMYFATYGRGLWKANINQDGSVISNNTSIVENSFIVYPNPFESNLNMESLISDVIYVIDATGRTVNSFEINKNEKLTKSFENLPEGVYFLIAHKSNYIQKVVRL